MPFNFPEPIRPRYAPPFTYPSDIKADNRSYYTEIRFKRYSPQLRLDAIPGVFNNIQPTFIDESLGNLANTVTDAIRAAPFPQQIANAGEYRGPKIRLPIPKKINEMNMMNWSEISLTGILQDVAKQALAGQRDPAAPVTLRQSLASAAPTVLRVASAFSGIQLNPFIMQYFQKPSFREFSFTWTLAPRNKKESQEINNIIRAIKAAQAPRASLGGFLMDYPDLAEIKFFPKGDDQIELKNCVIVGVNIDYTPAGPSYINKTSSPTMINLTMHLKETQLWWSNEWGGEMSTSEPVERPAENNDGGGDTSGGDTSGGVGFDFSDPAGPRGTDF